MVSAETPVSVASNVTPAHGSTAVVVGAPVSDVLTDGTSAVSAVDAAGAVASAEADAVGGTATSDVADDCDESRPQAATVIESAQSAPVT